LEKLKEMKDEFGEGNTQAKKKPVLMPKKKKKYFISK